MVLELLLYAKVGECVFNMGKFGCYVIIEWPLKGKFVVTVASRVWSLKVVFE